MPMPRPGSDVQFDTTPVVTLLAKREGIIDSIVQLRQAGLRSQTAYLLARLATTGDANYVAQTTPIAQAAAESMDNALLDGMLDILNIDQTELPALSTR